MAGLMDKFFGAGAKHAGQQGQQQQQPPGPGGIPFNGGQAPQGTSTVAPNGVTPTVPPQDPNATQQTQQDKSPFAEFEKLWEPATGPDGKPVQVTTDPLYTVDQNKVLEAAKRTDFKSAVTQEQMQKIVAGGPEAAATLVDVMQTMSQLAYANAAVAATKIAEQGINKAMSQAEKRLPGVIRQQQFGEGLAQKNPALQNPAVKPMIDMLASQFGQKYPNATSAELIDMAERYMTTAADAFNPTKLQEAAQQQAAAQKENENWDVFFNQQSGGNPFSF